MLSVEVIRSYIVCATPRSGSNWLCELLSALGFAGRPEEHLWRPSGTDLEPVEELWPHVLRKGTGDNGVFGLKLMWYQAQRLEEELPRVLGMWGHSLAHALEDELNDPRYIYLTRTDRLRQAISLARAIQTDQWRSMDGTQGAAQYGASAIRDALLFLERDEAHWEAFFSRNGLHPVRVSYEDLTADPSRAVGTILHSLGANELGSISLPATRHQRQSDEVTEEWVRRYVREDGMSPTDALR